MARTPDSNMEKLDELYKHRDFLKTKRILQIETYARTGDAKHGHAINRTEEELEENQQEIDKRLDLDL